jgi:hypothetical protein
MPNMRANTVNQNPGKKQALTDQGKGPENEKDACELRIDFEFASIQRGFALILKEKGRGGGGG